MSESSDVAPSDSGMTRRSVLGGIGGTVAASALTPPVALAAKKDKDVQYAGKAYDPLTDKEQGDASAVLNVTDNGLKGRLEIAGFDIPIGRSGRIAGNNTHPTVETFRFEKDAKRFTVTEDGEELPLQATVSVLNGLVSGLVTRPSPKYGDLAFSLNPTEKGFSAEAIGNALRPDQKANIVPGFEKISMPQSGIPKSNSISNVRSLVNEKKQRPTRDHAGSDSSVTSDSSTSDVGTMTVEDNSDVGFLDATSGGETSMWDSYPDECIDGGGDRTMSWNLEFGTSGKVRYESDGSVWSDYDEIVSTNAKRWQMQAHFSQVPDTFVEDCDSDEGVPYQTKVEFKINQANDTSRNEVGLEQPEPNDKDDESSPDDGFMDLTLDIINSVSGPYGSVATTLVDYALAADSGTDLTVDNDTSYSEGGTDQQQYYWELPLDGYEDDPDGSDYFSDHTDNTAGVSIQVSNFTASGYTHDLDSDCMFTFGHLDYYDGVCPCPGSAYFKQETAYEWNYNSFTSVSQ
jgi:hypothetical protein